MHSNKISFYYTAGDSIEYTYNQQEKTVSESHSNKSEEAEFKGDTMDSHQQQFCLKWNSFGSNLATAFSNLFKSESLTDVTLFCEGE